jgi:hypothetical protein
MQRWDTWLLTSCNISAMLRPCRRLSSEWTSSAMAAKSYSVRCGGIDARAHENQTSILQSGPKIPLQRSMTNPPTNTSNCAHKNPVSGSVLRAKYRHTWRACGLGHPSLASANCGSMFVHSSASWRIPSLSIVAPNLRLESSRIRVKSR